MKLCRQNWFVRILLACYIGTAAVSGAHASSMLELPQQNADSVMATEAPSHNPVMSDCHATPDDEQNKSQASACDICCATLAHAIKTSSSVLVTQHGQMATDTDLTQIVLTHASRVDPHPPKYTF